MIHVNKNFLNYILLSIKISSIIMWLLNNDLNHDRCSIHEFIHDQLISPHPFVRQNRTRMEKRPFHRNFFKYIILIKPLSKKIFLWNSIYKKLRPIKISRLVSKIWVIVLLLLYFDIITQRYIVKQKYQWQSTNFEVRMKVITMGSDHIGEWFIHINFVVLKLDFKH